MRIRPVNPARDMRAIADLIEVAFAAELDRSGNNLIADMRHLAVLGPLLTLVDQVTPFASGYVCEENGRVVGNVTVTPEGRASRRWFISNVAVHPQYQRRGIGRQLMEAATAEVRRQGGQWAILQVRSENEVAQRLYRRLGFVRYDTIVELLRPGSFTAPPWPSLPYRRLGRSDWQALFDLACAATPPLVQRVRGPDPDAFRPTLLRCLREWLDGALGVRQTLRWGVEEDGGLSAVVSILAHADGTPARLDLAVRPGRRGNIEGPLTDLGLAALRQFGFRPVAANPSTSHAEAVQALQERSFTTVRQLDQLALEIR